MSNAYAMQDGVAVQMDAAQRATFIGRAYSNLFMALCVFTGIEVVLFKTGLAANWAMKLSQNWFLVLGAFMIASWGASHVAHRAKSLPMQYAALYGFVLLKAVIFLPLLYVASANYPGAISSAAFVTLAGFGALTAVAFITRKDFSFLRGILVWGGICAILAIGAAMIFGFTLGPIFCVGMVALAGASILYDTSNIIHHYPEDRYVAASLSLFSSVAIMFWYVLRLFMSRE